MTPSAKALRVLCARLRLGIPAIIADWQEIVREEAGRALPSDYSLEELAEVVLGIVEASLCRPANVRVQQQFVRAAGAHGAGMRRQGLSDALVLIEYDLLRRAIWHRLARLEADPATALALITRVDQAITLSTAASMYGYASPADWEQQRTGEWVARLVARGCP